jgi:O-acetylhomoserine/O-acetylserine sulfhydrylase-like pyridoxal-dependent enzyme
MGGRPGQPQHTKFLNGHGTCLGGILIDGGNFDWTSGRFVNFTEPDPSYHGLVYSSLGPPAFIVKARVQMLRDLGVSASPFNSWLTVQGVETLSLRMRASRGQCLGRGCLSPRARKGRLGQLSRTGGSSQS